ncbi:MAG: PQQ-like beta-propeller repeat protein, partial [Planctomycetia bacterium]|nr:PQQ-like beta-propeller repeat protein [Planctomycetia bacterium]
MTTYARFPLPVLAAWLALCCGACSKAPAEQVAAPAAALPTQAAPTEVVQLAAVQTEVAPTNAAQTASTLPPDLGTRPAGSDWAAFLGPTGDGKSQETGLISPWPAVGPKLVWQIPVGIGYGMPAISRGRMFQFDMRGKKAKLTCAKSETAEELWKFEYPTDYEDMYGYDNGPRCMPIVDGDMVYIFGAEGMLHALRTVDGSLVWKADTTRDYGVVQNFFGVGYGMPAVSRGRLFQFDMRVRKAQLLCLKAETAEELWKFEYSTEYEDMYGYDNGPRCMPVVDGDMVYIFGAEGVLHA